MGHNYWLSQGYGCYNVRLAQASAPQTKHIQLSALFIVLWVDLMRISPCSLITRLHVYIYKYMHNMYVYIQVVPHKAVAEISEIGNL